MITLNQMVAVLQEKNNAVLNFNTMELAYPSEGFSVRPNKNNPTIFITDRKLTNLSEFVEQWMVDQHADGRSIFNLNSKSMDNGYIEVTGIATLHFESEKDAVSYALKHGVGHLFNCTDEKEYAISKK